MVNSGRLSTACCYETPLSTPDRDEWSGSARLGAPLPDAPMRDASGQPIWLLDAVGGDETLITIGDSPFADEGRVIQIGRDLIDAEGYFGRRFDASDGAAYLVRPDQHLAARWRRPDAASLAAASCRLRGFTSETAP
jgi:3-(3-hydroxy-phenyl)propionate hydroxylase